jgi:hypothetical protein
MIAPASFAAIGSGLRTSGVFPRGGRRDQWAADAGGLHRSARFADELEQEPYRLEDTL